jgi:hypothetical protein
MFGIPNISPFCCKLETWLRMTGIPYEVVKAWSRPYMREYMRKVRARQKLERERDETVNAAIARLFNRELVTDLSSR